MTLITISASDLSEKAVYRFKAMSGEILKASAEVTVMRLQDGQNGTSAYVHIAYANSSDGRVDFSLTDSNRKFIGQYSDSKQYGSDDPTKYRWSAIKGEDGQSFVSAEEQFYYSTSQTELVGGEWFVGNVVYQSDKFLWKRWKCTYANPSEIKYTKAIFDNTWNEIDSKIGEIHTQVSQANTQSKEAVNKATQAQTDANKANQLANTANTQSSEAKKLAQDANTSTGKAQKQIDAIKGDITDSKKQIQSAVDKANANAGEIATVKETYATKVDLTNESKSIHADVSTEIEKKVGELSTTVSQTYASKSDLTSIEGSLNTKIKQNADSITTQASSIEKLQSDTTQAQKDITDATKKATDAQTLADKALGNAQSAQTLADQAKKKADSAQTNLDNANKELVDAKKNLESVTGRVDASEKEISDAKTRLSKAESDVTQAQKDATTAQGNAQTAINNAKTAQSTADAAKANAEQAQKDLNDLTNRVTKTETAIKQNADKITLQAQSITEVKNNADSAKAYTDAMQNYGYQYAKELYIKGDTDKYYPVIIYGGNQDKMRDIVISRNYSYQAPAEWDGHLSTHGISLNLKIKCNFGGWGGATYKHFITDFSEEYGHVFAGCVWVANYMGYAIFLRGGGENGAFYMIYSDQPLVTKLIFNPQKEGCEPYYNGSKDLLGNSGENYKWYAPEPRVYSDAIAEQIANMYTDEVAKNAKNVATSANTKIDNLKVGGRNLLRNTAFNTFDYWTIINANASIVDGWCEFTIQGNWNGMYQNFIPKKDVEYILSYEAYLVDTTATSNRLESDFGSPDNSLNITKTPTKYTKKVPYPASTNGIINFQLESSEVGKKWRIRNIKLEEGNKATDWTPAPEDVDEAINTERTERQSAIETKANEITSKVSETYVSNSAFEHYQNTVSTQFTQTKKDFTWSINQSVNDAKNEMNGQINGVNGRVDGLKQTTDNVNNYMSFDNDGLTLGKSDSAFKTKITNQEWSIQKNGAKVTYINDQTMYITDGQFTQSLKIGNFGFVPRANGSLDFKKIR